MSVASASAPAKEQQLHAEVFLGVNIGCGTSVADGWYNIDNSPTIWLSRIPVLRSLFRVPAWPKSVHRHDVLKGLPFGNETVDCIYSSHTFEHFTYAQSLFLTKECLRVLKPSGILRIVVPDLKQLVQDYLSDPDSTASHRFIERLSLSHTWQDLVHRGAHHQQMFDGRSLLGMLDEAGFENAQLSNFSESRIMNLAGLELAQRRHESIYVEAYKLHAQDQMQLPKGA
ncbi:MAG TPA: methyltransferase domain-containing protein [Terriglobales bacterium]|jgi:predicted SAM-dependent methyltransferase